MKFLENLAWSLSVSLTPVALVTSCFTIYDLVNDPTKAIPSLFVVLNLAAIAAWIAASTLHDYNKHRPK